MLWILEHPATYTAGVSFNNEEIIDKKKISKISLKELNDTAFVIVGDGPMKNIYIKAAKKEGVTDKIFFIDSVP